MTRRTRRNSMKTSLARLSLPLVVAACALFSAPLRAQDEEGPDEAEMQKLNAPFKKAIATGKELEKAQVEKDAKEAADETKKALAGDPLFDFDLDVKTIDGKKIKLSELKGKVVIVDVWGTWCPPCRKEIPHFVKL